MKLTQKSGSSCLRTNAQREVVKGAAPQIVLVQEKDRLAEQSRHRHANTDDLLRGDLSREELLRQAKQAATEYLHPMLPEKKASRWVIPMLLLIAAAAGFGLGVLIGI